MIFGESAGAASVSVQTVMPKSFGLFRRAAMQSGGYQVWAAKTTENAKLNFAALASGVGCGDSRF